MPWKQYDDLNPIEENFLDDLMVALEHITPTLQKGYQDRNI